MYGSLLKNRFTWWSRAIACLSKNDAFLVICWGRTNTVLPRSISSVSFQKKGLHHLHLLAIEDSPGTALPLSSSHPLLHAPSYS